MDSIFKFLLKLGSFRHGTKETPYRNARNEILTGYIGEKMHSNFYRVNRLKKRM